MTELVHYFGVIFDNKLSWKKNVGCIIKKADTRVYCLRKLKSFGISPFLLAIFYSAVVCSAPIFGVVCWRENISKHKRGRLDKMGKKGGQVVDISGQSIKEVYFRWVRHQLATILNDSTHPLYSDSSQLKGSRRLQVPLTKTNQLKFSFVPSAVM